MACILSVDEPEQILKLTEAYPEFEELYKHVYKMCRSVEDVMGIFSEELRMLDRNTAAYMIDEMQEKINKQTKELVQQSEQVAIQNKQLAEQSERINKQESALEEKERLYQEALRQIEGGFKERDLIIYFCPACGHHILKYRAKKKKVS